MAASVHHTDDGGFRMTPAEHTDPPPWFASTPPVRPALTQQQIVEAAHRLVHDGGVEALTLRSLSSDLGVGTSAIYRRIEGKEHLLVAVADLVLAEVEFDGRSSVDWREGLRSLAVQVREVLGRHPHVHAVLDSYLLAAPSVAGIAIVAIETLGRSGLPAAEIADAYNAWAGYVFGFSMMETLPGPQAKDRDLAAGWLRAFMASVDPREHPTLTGVGPSIENHTIGMRWEVSPLGPEGQSFDYGLELLLDGLEARASRGS
jgi:AcrR family transcriptional regulator